MSDINEKGGAVVSEVTKDLQDLVNLELPPKSEPFGRNVVKITILCFAILLLTCVAGLVYALRASTHREDALNESLQCVRRSAFVYESAIGDGVKLIVDLDVPITKALLALESGNQIGLDSALLEIERTIDGDGTADYPGSENIKKSIDSAVQGRRNALDEC